MPKKIGPLDVYNLLPKTNCNECEEANCMAFAAKVVERTLTVEKCSPLLQEKYKESLEKLRAMLRPPVKEVLLGSGDHVAKVGGKLVMFRHELRYTNPTLIAVDVNDEMPEAELVSRVKQIEGFEYRYIGKLLKLDAVAVRSTSQDPSRFGKAVEVVAKATGLPLILCALNPEVLENGLLAAQEKHPLIYAATKENWKDVGELALMYKSPLAVTTKGDLKLLKSLTNTLLRLGVEDLVLDPGTSFMEGLNDTINNLTQLRWSACREDDLLLGFPLMGAPLAVWTKGDEVPEVTKWKEAILASMLLIRYADILIMHSLDAWVLLPLTILRENIYTDPVKPTSVEAGLKTLGNPTENSPVMFTTNFALTYFTVTSDIESAKKDCYLIVVDTEGLSVESSVAGRKLTAEKIADTIKETGIKDKVRHRKLIIPGLAARLRGELEELTGWEVLVGPKDSSGIPKFLEEQGYT